MYFNFKPTQAKQNILGLLKGGKNLTHLLEHLVVLACVEEKYLFPLENICLESVFPFSSV